MLTNDDVLQAITEHQVRYVELWFTDIIGTVKNVTIPASEIEDVLTYGEHFDGSSIDAFVRVAESDMVLRPDPETFTLLPEFMGAQRTARLICSVYTPQGEPFIGDPRNVLINMLKQAETMGFEYKTGMELEFFLFRMSDEQPIVSSPHDQAEYFDLSNDNARMIRQEMVSILSDMGIGVASTHSEIAFGQHEIDFQYDSALRSADNMLTARTIMKSVARNHDLHCTFMPRPRADLPGSGMHTHQSLHHCESDENLFFDATHEYGLSELACYFLAGQLHHARAMCAVLAPLVNSYKRLGTSFEAPVYVTWAHINRAALIRVPGVTPGKESHTRLELRCPDPSSNPYLASAVMLMAGLDGVREQMTLPAPLEETLLQQDRSRMRHLQMLPVSLGEALQVLSHDDVILSALGPYISDRYLAAKRQEFEEYNQQVTPWEVERYLNRY
ncbi:MAG: glutamine synthetase [Chloroflexi bacterium]|nr:MAG: glutamine synthetase [Phototrophicales bacterium]RMF78408.1 MAG: glutamine synthetase [Chloroflexota bacterium]